MYNFLNYEEDLAKFLEEQEQTDCSITENTNQIYDKETANYYIKKVKELQSELNEINETATTEAKKQVERIESWRLSTSKQYEFLIDKYMAMLRDFWVTNGNDKTMKLSHGSLCMRKMRNKTDFDEDTVLQFLQDHNLDDYIENKPVINKTNLKDKMIVENGNAYLDINGNNVRIDGINIIEQAPKFEVK